MRPLGGFRGKSGETRGSMTLEAEGDSPVAYPLPGLLLLESRGRGDFLLAGPLFPLPPLPVEHDLGGHGLLTLTPERPDEVRELRASGGRLVAEQVRRDFRPRNLHVPEVLVGHRAAHQDVDVGNRLALRL